MATDSSTSATGAVPHPLHAYVTALLARVRTAQSRLHDKQRRPAVAISNGTAWVSTAATLWAQEFTPQTARYVASVRALDDGLVDLLQRTPTTCTPEEAARWRAKLGAHRSA